MFWPSGQKPHMYTHRNFPLNKFYTNKMCWYKSAYLVMHVTANLTVSLQSPLSHVSI